MAWRPLVALMTSISWFSSTVVRAKMLRASSSTTSTLRPRRTSLEPCSRSSICCFSVGQVGDDAVQEQRRLVEQPLGRLHVLEHDALGHRLELRLLLGGQLLAGEDDDRARRAGSAPPELRPAARSRSCPAGAGRGRSSRSGGPCSACQRLAAGADGCRSRCRRGRAARRCCRARCRCPRRPAAASCAAP